MPISRRTLLRRLGAGAAGAVTAPHEPAGLQASRLAGLEASGLAGWQATPVGSHAGTSRPGGPIRLNRNENTYGPSAHAIAAMQDAASTAANRYPDVEADALRHKIAAHHHVPPEQVVLGCGSGEILRVAIDAFAGARRKLVASTPTFESIGGWARRAGAEVVSIPLRADYTHDLNAMLARIDAETKLVYICNPNNPTGRVSRRQDLDGFLRKLPATILVLMDEAYHHYVGESSDYASFIDRPADDSRVIVTRSFSKVHGLAGLRVGYAVAGAPTARILASRTLSDGVNVVAARAAAAALDDVDHVRTSVNRNTDDRQEFLNQATARMLRLDSLTNFIMVETGHPAVDVVEHFKKHRILVSGPLPGLAQNICVSLGTPAEMREFWRVWDLLMPGHKMGR